MSKLYKQYLTTVIIGFETIEAQRRILKTSQYQVHGMDPIGKAQPRDLQIIAMALRDRHNGKLLTRAEFLAEIGIKGKPTQTMS